VEQTTLRVLQHLPGITGQSSAAGPFMRHPSRPVKAWA
jgi:hypothetical protein